MMNDNQKLYEKIETVKIFNPENFEIPKYITDNLKYELFDWQKEAFENFLFYQNPKFPEQFKKSPTHLMFNMATGTGKTLVMAATILYYYQQGYRHFLFFVNQNNIVDKTENNFIDNTHNKYLFNEKIIIDDKTVAVEKVETFSDDPQGIEIKFTSIHKLYNDVHLEKENATTLEDLQSKNIVMLADEAHHLNANTKNVVVQKQAFEEKLSGTQAEKEEKGWEHTVIELILKKQGKTNNTNVLLEFTATIPNNQSVAEKYHDKIIYKFDLKQFLQAGFTKEINLISSTLDKKERILQALLFQWYRHKIALKHDIANFKPVILFRSKTIAESKKDYADFLNLVNDLDAKYFDFLTKIADKLHQSKTPDLFEMGRSRTEQLLAFIKNENINYSEIAEWIKSSFQEKNTIITNSKTNKTKKEKTDNETEKLLNSLEDKNNHIRAIFTVDRLTEGWDVLNLFDIVRLYQGQNAGGSTKKTPEATTKEKQLIGRGVRYFPFSFGDKIKNKRKLDNDLDNELRILEELFYYTYDEDSKYISHLKAELKKDGYIKEDRMVKTFDLKPKFKEGNFYKNTQIWYNEKIDNPERKKKDLQDVKDDFSFEYRIESLELKEDSNVLDEKLEAENKVVKTSHNQTTKILFKDIEKHIVQKAIHIKAKETNSLFCFENLKKELNIKSVEDLQNEEFLGDFEINVITKAKKSNEIENNEKLQMVLQFLDKVFSQLKENIAPKIGGKFKPASFSKFFGEPKTKSIDPQNENKSIAEDNEWYILDGFVGTSEEESLINFIKDSIGNIGKKYQEYYLLRNEEVYKIYDFEKGRGFAPDFLLFLKTKEKKQVGVVKTELYYQIFIEPKGDQFKDADGNFTNSKEGWKEKFLAKIQEKYGTENLIQKENPQYRLIGLPFYNKENEQPFTKEFNELINNSKPNPNS